VDLTKIVTLSMIITSKNINLKERGLEIKKSRSGPRFYYLTLSVAISKAVIYAIKKRLTKC